LPPRKKKRAHKRTINDGYFNQDDELSPKMGMSSAAVFGGREFVLRKGISRG